MFLYSDFKKTEIFESNKKKIKENNYKEPSYFFDSNIDKNIDYLKENNSKKNSFLEHYDQKEKFLEEKSKEYNSSKILKQENELNNKKKNNLIKILNGVMKSPVNDNKNLDGTFLTANGDFDENMKTIDIKTTQSICNQNLFSNMNFESDYHQ
jgi:hypothetical protein